MSVYTYSPNFNSYTYSCMHMCKQLFNFYIYIFTDMFVYVFTQTLISNLQAFDSHWALRELCDVSFVISEVFDWRWRDKVSYSCTYRRETHYAQSLPKALFYFIYIYTQTPLKDCKTSPCILFYLGWAALLGEYVYPKLTSAKLSVSYHEYVCHSYHSTLHNQSCSR